MRRETLLVLLFAGALSACTPGIGSSCIQSTDCSPTGQLLCDTSQTNGYCTIFNCEPDHCPSGSACIETNIAPLGCPYDDRHAPSRFSRILCLATCSHDSDCRQGDGYICIDPSTDGMLLVDLVGNDNTTTEPDGGVVVKICVPGTSHPVSAFDGSAAPVCSVSGPPVPDFDAGPGYQGDAAVDAGALDAGGDASEAGADAGTDATDAAID